MEIKTAILLLLMFIYTGTAYCPDAKIITIALAEPIIKTFTLDEQIDAIIWVETGNEGAGAYNRHEPQAKGIFQQWPIFVHDVNRILGQRKYKLSDRLNPVRAREMFLIYQRYYNPGLDFEKMCRVQCGGPDGWRQDGTTHYFELVKQRLNSL